MAEYPKINSIYKREQHSDNRFIIGEYSIPEFEILKDVKWEATEKIDGTNIRIELDCFAGPSGIEFRMEIHGRTSKANIPPHLLEKLHSIFDNQKWNEIFPNASHELHITLYGEGYGHKIQGCGGNYLHNEVDFILFDVKVGGWWLKRVDVEELATKMQIKVVPYLGQMTFEEAISYVKSNPVSVLKDNYNPQCPSEGLVLRAPEGICRRNGERLITKVKCKDFKDV